MLRLFEEQVNGATAGKGLSAEMRRFSVGICVVTAPPLHSNYGHARGRANQVTRTANEQMTDAGLPENPRSVARQNDGHLLHTEI